MYRLQYRFLRFANLLAYQLNHKGINKKNFFLKRLNVFLTKANVDNKIRHKKYLDKKSLEGNKKNKNILREIYKFYRAEAGKTPFQKRVYKAHKKECWCCGAKGEGVKLQIHHIISVSERPELATDVTNVVILCEYHHKQYHRDCKFVKKITVKV